MINRPHRPTLLVLVYCYMQHRPEPLRIEDSTVGSSNTQRYEGRRNAHAPAAISRTYSGLGSLAFYQAVVTCRLLSALVLGWM